MQMTANDIELEMYRSGLLAPKSRRGEVTVAAKIIRREAGRFDAARLTLCNGVPHWNAKTRRTEYTLTEAEQDQADAATESAKANMVAAFRSVMKRGTLYDFRRDPRSAVLRFVNKANTKDGWVQ